MKRNHQTEEQIITILKAHERSVSMAELARQHGRPSIAGRPSTAVWRYWKPNVSGTWKPKTPS